MAVAFAAVTIEFAAGRLSIAPDCADTMLGGSEYVTRLMLLGMIIHMLMVVGVTGAHRIGEYRKRGSDQVEADFDSHPVDVYAAARHNYCLVDCHLKEEPLTPLPGLQ